MVPGGRDGACVQIRASFESARSVCAGENKCAEEHVGVEKARSLTMRCLNIPLSKGNPETRKEHFRCGLIRR